MIEESNEMTIKIHFYVDKVLLIDSSVGVIN